MKKNNNFGSRKSILLTVIFLGLISPIMAQVDTVKTVQTDTINPMKADTVLALPPDTTTKPQEKKKTKNEFILYGGANLNELNVSSDQIDASSAVGYHFGVSYKQGRLFYWQVGARYSNAEYDFVSKTTSNDSGKLAVRSLDLPLTVGINFLSFVNRIFAIRAFVSVVPSFTLSVGDNNLNYTKDNVNSFIFYGQGGIGVNIAFVLVEVGYNYGFQDLQKDYSSKPGQAFVNVGFRF